MGLQQKATAILTRVGAKSPSEIKTDKRHGGPSRPKVAGGKGAFRGFGLPPESLNKMNNIEQQNNFIFSQAEIDNFSGFYAALKTVHDRLIKEGYIIKDGQIIPPSKKKLDNK